MQRSLGVLKLCCKFQVNIKKEKKKEEKKGKKVEGRKEGRKEGRNNSWSMFSMVRSLSLFFFSLGIDAMDYSNQSEKC